MNDIKGKESLKLIRDWSSLEGIFDQLSMVYYQTYVLLGNKTTFKYFSLKLNQMLCTIIQIFFLNEITLSCYI